MGESSQPPLDRSKFPAYYFDDELEPKRSARLNPWGVLERMLSIRVMVVALVLGAIVSTFTGGSVTVTLIVAGLVWVGYGAADQQMVKCDACGKRVKLGASTCHHCGYSRA